MLWLAAIFVLVLALDLFTLRETSFSFRSSIRSALSRPSSSSLNRFISPRADIRPRLMVDLPHLTPIFLLALVANLFHLAPTSSSLR